MTNRHYPLYKVNRYETFLEMLNDIARQYGEREAIVTFTPQGERRAYSFNRLLEDSLAFSAALSSMGLAGKHTAVAGGNSYQYLVSMFGVVLAGGVAVTLDTEQAEDVIVRMSMRAGVEAVICDGVLLPIFAPLKDSGVSHFVSLDEPGDEAQTFDELLSAGAMRMKMLAPVKPGDAEADRMSLIVFTSGTTSDQKPVMLSQKNLLTNGCGAAGMVFAGERIFTPLPLYHMYGLTCGVLGHISQGRTVGLSYSLKFMMRDLVLFKPHMVTAVPLVAEALYMRTMMILKKMNAAEEASAYFEAYFSKKRLPMPETLRVAKKEAMSEELCRMSCGGAHLNGKVLRDMDAMGVQILEGYGITECGPMVSCNRNDAQRLGSVGLPLPDTEIDFDDGEIIVRGLGISAGYYDDEKLTRDNFTGEWFHTGDLGYQDAEGYLFITGRKKNLIVFKNGKKVAPEEIEQYVANIPLIKEAIAYGASAGASDDDVQLALLVYPNPELTAHMESYEIMRALEDEIAKVNQTLPAYKQIQVVKLRDVPFEKTASQKIKRNIT